MATTQLRSVPPRRTPERERLAEAIADHAAAVSHLSRLKTARERADDLLFGEDGAIRAAEKAATALEEAKTNEGCHLAAVALGEAVADENPVKIAAIAIAEAEARLDTARRTQVALEEQAKAAESDLDSTNIVLEQCVRAVMRSEATALVDTTLREAESLQEQLGAKRVLLSFLKDACFDWQGKEARRPVADFLAAPVFPFEFSGRTKEHPALAPWHQLHEALRESADAPLPF